MAHPQKSRLGRGLGGLISAAKPLAPEIFAAGAHIPQAQGFLEIQVHLIEPSPYQARREIAPEQLAELAESIRSEGLLQPVVVRRHGDRFQLIAGERRWRAFQQLKIKAIPARIVEASDASAASIGLIENLQREGLNPIEEALGLSPSVWRFSMRPIEAADASLASTTRAGIVLILSCWKARQRRSPAISWYFSPCLRTTIGCRSPSLRMLSASSASCSGAISRRAW